MKKQLKTLLIILCFLSIGCKEEKKDFSDIFQNEVWYVDSTVTAGGAGFTGEVLKPVNDSVFDIYRDQSVSFEKYRFKEDTLILRRLGVVNKFIFHQISNDNVFIQSIDRSETHHLQNLTTLFNGDNTVEKENSMLYNELKNYTWYPIKIDNMYYGEQLNEPDPKDYYRKNAFYIPDTIKNKPYNNWFQEGFSYKFTDKALYLYDTNNKVLIAVMFLIKDDLNQIKLFEVESWNTFTLKKIDYAILK